MNFTHTHTHALTYIQTHYRHYNLSIWRRQTAGFVCAPRIFISLKFDVSPADGGSTTYYLTFEIFINKKQGPHRKGSGLREYCVRSVTKNLWRSQILFVCPTSRSLSIKGHPQMCLYLCVRVRVFLCVSVCDVRGGRRTFNKMKSRLWSAVTLISLMPVFISKMLHLNSYRISSRRHISYSNQISCHLRTPRPTLFLLN